MARRITFCAAVLFMLCTGAFFCAGAEPAVESSFERGLHAYRSGDWTSAVFMLRKAVSLKESETPEALYLLIMSEMYSGDYKNAANDCKTYLAQYSDTPYASYVQYQQGRCAYYLADYNGAVLLLSDFCHQNDGHEMYGAALYWMAEAFFAGYNYDAALPLYQRVVSDFAEDDKVPAAQYRIETIRQRGREEKLIYLLRKTSEEFLSARELYEKQLQEYKAKGLVTLQRQLKETEEKNAALLLELDAKEKKNDALQKQVYELKEQKAPAGQAAKAKSRGGI